MARRKASPSDLTNASVATAEHKADVKRDSYAEKLPDLSQTLRNFRAAQAKTRQLRDERKLSDDFRAKVLVKRATDAAALELRGDQWDTEDRKDAASDALLRVLTDFNPAVPIPSDRKASLSVFCGHVRNFRAARTSDRERDHAEYLATSQERGDDGLTELERRVIEDGRIMAANDRENAERGLAVICARLDIVNEPSPMTDALYSWLRGADSEVVRAERPTSIGAQYSAGSWRVRISKGGKLLKAAVPNALALLDALLPIDCDHVIATPDGLLYSLTDQSREAGSRTRCLADLASAEHWREGTNGGARPIRPIDASAARSLCSVTRFSAAPKRAEQNRDKLRRDHVVKVSNGREQRPMFVGGLSDEQRRATALRTMARASAQGRRERGVSSAADRSAERAKRAA